MHIYIFFIIILVMPCHAEGENTSTPITRAQKISDTLQLDHQAIELALDTAINEMKTIEKYKNIMGSSSNNEKATKFQNDLDAHIIKLIDIQQKTEEQLNSLLDLNKKCGLPPLVVKGLETAKSGAVAAGAYKLWLLQNAPGAGETVRTALIEHGILNTHATVLSERIGLVLKRASSRGTTIFLLTSAATMALLEATSDGSSDLCAYLEDKTNTVQPPKNGLSYKIIIPPLVGLLFVLLFVVARHKRLLD